MEIKRYDLRQMREEIKEDEAMAHQRIEDITDDRELSHDEIRRLVEKQNSSAEDN